MLRYSPVVRRIAEFIFGESVPARVFVLLMFRTLVGADDPGQIFDRTAAQADGGRLPLAVLGGGLAQITVV